MKNYRITLFLLVTFLIFNACKKRNEENPTPSNNPTDCKVTSVTLNGYENGYLLEYKDNKLTRIAMEGEEDTRRYYVSPTLIIDSIYKNNELKILAKYFLNENGYIYKEYSTNYDSYPVAYDTLYYFYNNDDYLIRDSIRNNRMPKPGESPNSTVRLEFNEYEWLNGNMVSIKSKRQEWNSSFEFYTTELQYSDHSYSDAFLENYQLENPFNGKRSKNLLKRITYRSDDFHNYEYVFDNNGRLKTMTDINASSDTTNYEMKYTCK